MVVGSRGDLVDSPNSPCARRVVHLSPESQKGTRFRPQRISQGYVVEYAHVQSIGVAPKHTNDLKREKVVRKQIPAFVNCRKSAVNTYNPEVYSPFWVLKPYWPLAGT